MLRETETLEEIKSKAELFIEQKVKIAIVNNYINISNAGLNDQHIDMLIAQLKKLSFMPISICLSNNRITDLGFKKLIDYCGINGCSTLDISNNLITIIGIRYLSTLSSTSLLKIDLSNNKLKIENHSELKELLSTGIFSKIFVVIDEGVLSEIDIKEIQSNKLDSPLHSPLSSPANSSRKRFTL